MATNLKSPNECAAALLDVVPAIMRTLRSRMRQASVTELTIPQFRTLGFLTRRPGSSLSEVAEHVGVSMPSASKLVQLLLVRGYIQRKADLIDRRKTVLAATPKGQRVVRAARLATQEFLAGLMSELDFQSRGRVLGAMSTLRDIFVPELPQAERVEG